MYTKILLKLTVVAFITFWTIKLTHQVAVASVNENPSEYAVIYKTVTNKGYLSNEDMQYLDEAYKKHLADDKAQIDRVHRYNNHLLIGMILFSVIAFGLIKIPIAHNVGFYIPTVLLVSSIASRSMIEGFIWTVFYIAGLVLHVLRFASTKK